MEKNKNKTKTLLHCSMGPCWEKPETPLVPTNRGLTYYNHSPSLEWSVTFHQRTENSVFENADPPATRSLSCSTPMPLPSVSTDLYAANPEVWSLPGFHLFCPNVPPAGPAQSPLAQTPGSYPRPPQCNPPTAVTTLSRVLPSCAQSPPGLPPPWAGGGKPKAL